MDFHAAFTHRVRLLDFLPSNLDVCEVGVYEGLFSRRILERMKPRSLTMIDPWLNHDDPNYQRDTANSSQPIQDERYASVRALFRDEVGTGRVRIIRRTCADAVYGLPDESFDFIYIDAMHYFDAVLSDLEAVVPKLRSGGILAGHDFAAHPMARRKNFGVVRAVDVFLERHREFDLCIMSLEKWPSFFLSRPESKMMRGMVVRLRNSGIPLLRLPQGLRARISQEVVPPSDGVDEQVIPRILHGTLDF